MSTEMNATTATAEPATAEPATAEPAATESKPNAAAVACAKEEAKANELIAKAEAKFKAAVAKRDEASRKDLEAFMETLGKIRKACEEKTVAIVEKFSKKNARPKRAASDYNNFIRDTVKSIRESDSGKDMPHKEVFKLAAERWSAKKSSQEGAAEEPKKGKKRRTEGEAADADAAKKKKKARK